MKQHGALCDVKLVCPLVDAAAVAASDHSSGGATDGVSGVEILAHKSVLASGCAFFYAQFTSEFLASGEEQNSAPHINDSLIMDERVRALYGIIWKCA